MGTTTLASYETHRLVRYDVSGEARIEGEDGCARSIWLSAEEVDAIRENPSLMAAYAINASRDSYGGRP